MPNNIKNQLKCLFASRKYSLAIFSACILYTLTALPRLEISDLFKNIIIFGSIPALILNFSNYRKSVFWLALASVLIQVVSWIHALVYIPEFAKNTPDLKPLSSLFLFVLIAIWVNGSNLRRIVLFSSFILSFIVTALCDIYTNDTLSLALSGQRIDYGMHNAQFTSMLSVVVCMLTLYILSKMTIEKKLVRIPAYALCCFIIAFALFSLYASQSRQVWLAAVVLLSLAPIVLVGTKHIRKLVITYSLLAVTLFGIFQLDSVKQRVFYESSVISTLTQGNWDNIPMTSIGIRVNSWLEASKWIAERPVLGSDFEAISYVTRTSEKFQTANLLGFGHLHNYFLEVWVAFGVVGLIFLIVFYREIFTNIINNQGKKERYLLYSFLIFWFIISMFESYNHKFLGLYVHTIILSGLYSLKEQSVLNRSH